MDQGDAFGLGGEHVIKALRVHQLQKLPGARHGQLRVAEDHECGDVEIVRHLADGQLTLQSGHV